MLTKTLIRHASSLKEIALTVASMDTSVGNADLRLVEKTRATNRGEAVEAVGARVEVITKTTIILTFKGTGGRISINIRRRIPTTTPTTGFLTDLTGMQWLATSLPTTLVTRWRSYNAIFVISEATIGQWTVLTETCISR